MFHANESLLSDAEKTPSPKRRWLGMVSEYTPPDEYGGDSSDPPKYTGWYFDLFPDRPVGANRDVAVVADWFALTNANQVGYLGVRGAAVGVFAVDVGGEPRAMVAWTASNLAPNVSDVRVARAATAAPADVTVTLLDDHGDALVPAATLHVTPRAPAVVAFELKVGAWREARAAFSKSPTSPSSPSDPSVDP